MEKKQAQEYIKEVLSSKFDPEKFENFMRNLVNNFEPKDNGYSGNLIPEAFREHIAYYKRIGKYTDPEGEQLDILIVQTRYVSKLERARTALRNFVVRHLKNFEKQYALVAFYSKEDDGADWRLSLVKIDYETQRSEQGRIKIKEELVPAKRFSFLVGEHEDSYTAQKQLLPLLTNTYSDPLIVMEKDGDGSIEGAFGIERVTDEFYEQYKELFLKLSENKQLYITLEKAGLDPIRFLKKLLGQIVFLYFLQKKGWLGVPKDRQMGEGSKRFLQDRFASIEAEGKNYFNDFLRHLFYAALAREHNDDGIKYYFNDLKCKVPFLNGGLFEADYDWEHANIVIPNDLFRNSEKNKAGDKGIGILDVFDRYNFTIKEDEPLEKEVAVDPEMLGKVFENMLEITERKSKGAFYTPREIVHYMCQESLIHYLDNAINDYVATYQALDTGQTNLFGGSADKKGNLKLEVEYKDGISVPKEDIEEFIRNGHLALENDEAALAARQRMEQGAIKSTKQKQLLPETISRHAERIDKALADIKICDPAIGSGAFPVGLLHEIVTARKVLVPYLSRAYINSLQIKSGIVDSDTMPSEYYFKRHAIQESIYGVDIDASAIDIARLRLWLSMIVEEDDYETIEALPNLDYKIVCGNSLIGLPENAMRDLMVEAELEQLKEDFFNKTDENQKKALREQINAKIRQLLDSAETFAGYSIDFDFKLYFSEVWHKKGGFDIVIGNPPYGVSIRGHYRDTVLRQFEKVPDYEIYYFFIELSKKLLKIKGLNSYIIPNTILFNVYSEKYRKSILNYWKVHEILDCTDFKLFKNAVVRNIIYIFEKGTFSSSIGYRNSFDVSSFHSLINRPRRVLGSKDIMQFNQNWGLAFKLKDEVVKVIRRIKEDSTNLEFFNPDISQGLIAYDKYRGQSKDIIENRAYHFTEYREGLKKWLMGEDVTRYKVRWNGIHYIDYCDGIANPRDPKFFIGDRVLVREITNPRIYAAYTHEEYYNDPALLIIKTENGKINKFDLTAILNSELATFLHFNNSPKSTKGEFPKILITDIKTFPAKAPSKNYSMVFKILLEYLQILINNPTKEILYNYFDNVINSLVYELYFTKEFNESKKQILFYLLDMKPIVNANNEEQKLAIIQSEFERLYDPNHPVRNNLETLDSIEEVRIIKNALR